MRASPPPTPPRPSRTAWIRVVLAAAAVGVATWAVTRYVPVPTGTRIGDRAPDVRVLALPTGDSVDLRSAFAGHVTLINLWATWCQPCLAEMPSIERLYQAYRGRGFRVAAVSIDQSDSVGILAFAERLGATFAVFHDGAGRVEQAYQAVGVPESFLLDRRGRIRSIAIGAKQWDSAEHRAQIDRLLDRAD